MARKLITIGSAAIIGAYLTRAITAEQINANRGGKPGMSRFGEVRQIDKEARTVELSFSSEAPVARWFGEEVLDHGPGSMVMTRMDNGAALLVNHDWDDQIGVVESVTIGSDRKGRALVRFGKSARAEEIWNDVADGIRKHVSVGYSVRKIEVTPRKGQPDLVRVIEWEPFEVSLVAIPADPTVGVGRSLENAPEDAGNTSGEGAPIPGAVPPKSNVQHEVRTMNWKTYRDAQGNLVRVQMGADGQEVAGTLEILERAGAGDAANRQAGADAERTRTRTILEMGTQYRQPELAAEFARDGKTPEEFQRKLLEVMAQNRGGNIAEGAGGIGLTDREVRQYSFLRVLRALAAPTDRAAQEAAAFEFEASRAAADQVGRQPKGILVPADVLSRGLIDVQGRAMNTSTAGGAAGNTGGYSIATDLLSQSFIEMLRNRAVAMQLGTPMGGLVGNIDIPRQASGASGYWIGEDDEATLTGLELDQIGMTPKTVAAMSEITRKLLQQSSLDVEGLVRRDLATALALTIDKAFFYGSGSANQPRGVTNYAGINAVDFGTDGAGAGTGQMPSYADLVGMETAIATDNADVNSMAYVFNAAMRGHMKTTAKFASGTDAGVIWETGNTVNGYRSEVTNQVNAGDVVFGNFADAMIGMWGGLDLTADPYTHSARGRLRIVAMQDVDFVLRRVESFCLGRDSTA